MSFAGALGRGLLGAAKMTKMAEIEQQVWAARQKAIEEQRVASEQKSYELGKGRTEQTRAEDATVAQGYVDKAKAAGGDYTAFKSQYTQALTAGHTKAAEALRVQMGESPAEARKRVLDEMKTLSDINKGNASADRMRNVLSSGQVEFDDDGNIKAMNNNFRPGTSGAGAGSGGRNPEGRAFTDGLFKAAFHKDVTVLNGKQGLERVSKLDKELHQEYVTWADANKMPAELVGTYNSWLVSKSRASNTQTGGHSPAGAKYPQPDEEAYNALPVGAQYRDPEGNLRTKTKR